MINRTELDQRSAHHPPAPAIPQSSEGLLQYYLNLPAKERDKQFANTASAAELIGRSQRTIQRWIEEGLIRAVSIVGRELVLISSLREFVQRQSHKRA